MTLREPLSFRPARADDLEELERIGRASFATAWSRDSLRGELDKAHTRALCAVSEQGVCGYALGWRIADELQLLQVAVAPESRCRGVAGALFASYREGLRGEGCRRLTLEVRRSNAPARALYERAGLQLEGQRKRYYADGEDALLYGGNLE